MTDGIVATWCRLHRLRLTLGAVAVVSGLTALGVTAYVPGVAGGPRLPVWQLVPAGFGTVAGLAVGHDMSRCLANHGVRGRRAVTHRLAVVAAVSVAVAAGSTSAVVPRGLPGLSVQTVLVVWTTFGLSAALGRWAAFGPVALAGFIVVRAPQFVDIPADGAWVAPDGVLGACGVAGLAAYVVWGPRLPA